MPSPNLFSWYNEFILNGRLFSKREALNEAPIDVCYKKIFNTPEGKRVLNDLVHRTRFFSALPNANTEALLDHNGQRTVMMYISSMLGD